jgi:2-hydroxy-6-oxo-6-(2'-aminophenyl)hexa-2,4-dienoate hydrolase
MTLPSLDGSGVESRFIDAGGVHTHYLEAGAGEPLVLIHGGGAGADAYGNWFDCIPIFAKTRRVIAVDMIGFGYTDKPTPDAPDAPGYVYDQPGRNAHLQAFLEAMDLGPAALVGNSMGGATAIGVALAAPQLISRFVLMGSAGLPIPERPSAHLMHTLQYDFTVEGMRRLVAGLTGPDFKPTEDMIQYRYEITGVPETKAALQAVNALTKTGTLNYAEDALRTIKHPVLVVNGKEDGVSILPRAYRFLELFENSWGYIVPHCGHWAMIEQRDDFCQAVEAFLARAGG